MHTQESATRHGVQQGLAAACAGVRRGRWLGAAALSLAGLMGCAAWPETGAGTAQQQASAPWTPRWSEAGCSPSMAAGLTAQLQGLQAELQALGLDLRVEQCLSLPAQRGQAVALSVRVVDGLRATGSVRGPLADGQPLDLGGSAGEAGLSPDVLFNRQWLRQHAQAHGLRAVPGHTAAFVPAP